MKAYLFSVRYCIISSYAPIGEQSIVMNVFIVGLCVSGCEHIPTSNSAGHKRMQIGRCQRPLKFAWVLSF